MLSYSYKNVSSLTEKIKKKTGEKYKLSFLLDILRWSLSLKDRS